MRVRRRATVGLVLASLLLVACSKDAPNALDPQGPDARSIASVSWLMFGLATAVYVVVAGFIIFGALRGRKPSRISDNAFIWVGGLIAPIIILAVLAVVTVKTTDALRQPEPNPLKIEVTGYMWWWAVRYPTEDITTANEIRVPAGRPVEIGLRTRDVIHSFWVPELAGKVDMVPGQRNVIRFTADEPGVYRGQCAEYCGLQHAHMAILVIAQPPDEFAAWYEQQLQPAPEPVDSLAERGREVFLSKGCVLCHTIRGTGARSELGPDLTHVASRLTLAAGTIPNTKGYLGGWIANPQQIKPGNRMPQVPLTSAEFEAILHYLQTLK